MPDLKEILQNRNVVVPEDYETFKDIFVTLKVSKLPTFRPTTVLYWIVLTSFI